MTRKERRTVIEGAALLSASAALVLFVMPSMINARDSVAFVVGVLMAAGCAVWGAYYIYRNWGDSK